MMCVDAESVCWCIYQCVSVCQMLQMLQHQKSLENTNDYLKFHRFHRFETGLINIYHFEVLCALNAELKFFWPWLQCCMELQRHSSTLLFHFKHLTLPLICCGSLLSYPINGKVYNIEPFQKR